MVSVTDLFCGAGGSSIGAEAAGARLRIAANHWRVAVGTHAANFPHADHDCADISQVDPRRYPPTDVLLASPECTHHSRARSVRHHPSLFNPEGDPAAERSRATMWDVPRFAECHRYRIVVVENVLEIMAWAPLGAWLAAMESLGYAHRLLSLNSFIAGATPQSRDRLYGVFWRKEDPAPDLEFTPASWCPVCEASVQALQRFKPARAWGRYGAQYLYTCPGCGGLARPFAHPAATAIDWSLPAPRIGERSRPLAPATLRRIEAGLARFGQSLVVPLHHARNGPPARPLTALWPTRTGRSEHALALGFIAELRGGGSTARSIHEPLATICASGNHHGLIDVAPAGDPITSSPRGLPFTLTYNRTGAPTPVDRPLPTVTTRDRHALVEPRIEVAGCGFRMLQPHEIAAAMAFPATYVVGGTKRERVRQLGNAVTPPIMAMILRRCIASLSPETSDG